MKKGLKTLLISAMTLVSMLGLASCKEEELSTEQAILKQALDTPSLAIKANGFSLESVPKDPERISGAIIMLRDLVVYDKELDDEFDVEVTWSIQEETRSNWGKLNELNGVPGLVTDTRVYVVSPLLPAFGEESVPSALIATAHLVIDEEEFTRVKEYPVILLPEEIDLDEVKLIPLNAIKAPDDTKKDSYGNKLVRVRGYLTRSMSDWNASFVNEGIHGISLYRLDTSPELIINANPGEYVEVMGQFGIFNGLRQLSYITRLSPISDEGATPLDYKTITAEDWDKVKIGDDGGQIRIEGLTYEGHSYKKGGVAQEIPEFIGSGHVDIYMKLGSKQIIFSMNYHNDIEGVTRRQEIYEVLAQAVNGATVTYTGVLGWFDVPVALPILLSDVTLVPAPAVTS